MTISTMRPTQRMRSLLLRLHTSPVPVDTTLDRSSPDYLLLVQQCKRVSMSRELARLTLKNLPLWPWIVAVLVVRWVDLALTNTLIRSLINERDLLRQSENQDTR